MTTPDGSETKIVDLDTDSLTMMSLNGRLCFNCPLLEGPGESLAESNWCQVSSESLQRLVRDERSGVKLALHAERVVGYGIFGRPALFPNLDRLGFEVDGDSLLVAALYATPMAEAAGVDVNLLIEIMGFAREQGYATVQAVCRPEGVEGPEGASQLFAAAGFEVSDPVKDRCLAQVAVEDWAEADDDSEDV
jgi:hypothetical protein